MCRIDKEDVHALHFHPAQRRLFAGMEVKEDPAVPRGEVWVVGSARNTRYERFRWTCLEKGDA